MEKVDEEVEQEGEEDSIILIDLQVCWLEAFRILYDHPRVSRLLPRQTLVHTSWLNSRLKHLSWSL